MTSHRAGDSMRRRDVIGILGGAMAAWPGIAPAQQREKFVVGWLGFTSESGETEMVSAFRRGLEETGFDGGRVNIEFRFAGSDVSRLPLLANELVEKAALVFTGTTVAALAAKKPPQGCQSCSL